MSANLNALTATEFYLIFGIVFGALILCAIVVCVFDLVLVLLRRKLSAREPRVYETAEIASDDVTLRIRGNQVETFETPVFNASAADAPEEENFSLQDVVVLPKTEKHTFAERYEELSADSKALLDEFTRYVTEKEDCSSLVQTSSLTFKYKKGQILKAVIRRDVVVLNFAILNPDFGRMVKEEKTGGLKVRPVEIRLTSEEALAVAKQTADLTVDYLRQEEEYRQEKRKEARREAARKRRAGSAESAETAQEE